MPLPPHQCDAALAYILALHAHVQRRRDQALATKRARLRDAGMSETGVADLTPDKGASDNTSVVQFSR